MLVSDDVATPEPDTVTELTSFGAIRDEIEWGAKATLGRYNR